MINVAHACFYRAPQLGRNVSGHMVAMRLPHNTMTHNITLLPVDIVQHYDQINEQCDTRKCYILFRHPEEIIAHQAHFVQEIHHLGWPFLTRNLPKVVPNGIFELIFTSKETSESALWSIRFGFSEGKW